ncbi:MAG: DUF1501 domain-containing protein [Verrucomicrobia bacterium]|jgi:hypothetical protein|nr:DUF1501 domain-containing protein [Verrucomicrobiota bacterium]
MSTKVSRRRAIQLSGLGLGSAFLAASKAELWARSTSPLSASPPPLPAKAKRVIFLFMHGGPSHLDTFDFKPRLLKRSGEPLPFAKPRVQFAKTGNLLRSPWEFRRYGQSGAWVSDLFPKVSTQVDHLSFIKSIHGSNEAHGGALLKIHTGSDTFVRPSMGAWISYGLGTENPDLPSYITINPTLGHGGVQNFGSAFLPPIHQATRIGKRGQSVKGISIANLANPDITSAIQREQLAFLRQQNQRQLDRFGPSPILEARTDSFDLAYRMQSSAPELMNVESESKATQTIYGIGEEKTENFGRQCLLARRLSESGVRFVQCSHGYWDQHSNLKKQHGKLAAEVDQPICGLLTDLRSRGLLDETLVIWGGEFGRTPTAQGKDGRDHNPHAFTWWFAGGGTKPGVSYGETDEFGYYAVNDKVHIHDLHATILHLLGIQHEDLTYRHAGRDFRLTDVSGRVVKEILA